MREALRGILVNSELQYLQTVHVKDTPNRFDEFFPGGLVILAMSRFQIGGRWYAVVLDDDSLWKAKGQFYIAGMRSPCPGIGIILRIENEQFSSIDLSMGQVRSLLRWQDPESLDDSVGGH